MATQNSKDESVRRQLLALANMSRPELCEKWRDLYGNEPPNSSMIFENFPQFFIKVFVKVGWEILCFLCR